MEDTGLIKSKLTAEAQRILYETSIDEQIDTDLPLMCMIDRAHLVMLTECGIVDHNRAVRLLRAIDDLEDERFSPLRGRKAIRGLFLLYEDYLIAKNGAAIGGLLQTARSRNDLNATLVKLKARRLYLRLVRECLRLEATLLGRARAFSKVVMPIFTHGQAALPGTYGHYLAGIAEAIARDVAGMIRAAEDLKKCPLGAGAAAGATLPIDTRRTTFLLGFEIPVSHSIDAVASRDLVLRLLGAIVLYGVTLSRLATDLLQWAGSEYNFLYMPDRVIGSSSAMPQKRNPFLLEHVRGRAAGLLGAFNSAVVAAYGAPFTNSICVGTEAVRPFWVALRDITEITTLARLVVSLAQPQPERMLESASRGMTAATELANRLVVEAGLDFRTAHHTVGQIVSIALYRGQKLEQAASEYLTEKGLSVSLAGLDPESIVATSNHGGGPGLIPFEACVGRLKREWGMRVRQYRRYESKWRASQAALDRAVHELYLTEES
jgi:argininosuccinate lyase